MPSRPQPDAASRPRPCAGRAAVTLPALLLAAALLATPSARGAEAASGPEAPPTAAASKFAGTYRIADWQAMEARGLYHFFYLHPAGAFLLAAEWPQRETSQAVGRWRVSGDLLSLTGTVRVRTNQGGWEVAFARAFHIRLDRRGFRLEPVPEKNRYGLLGWPDAFVFHRPGPAPNLPGRDLPAGEDALLALIRKLSAAPGRD